MFGPNGRTWVLCSYHPRTYTPSPSLSFGAGGRVVSASRCHPERSEGSAFADFLRCHSERSEESLLPSFSFALPLPHPRELATANVVPGAASLRFSQGCGFSFGSLGGRSAGLQTGTLAGCPRAVPACGIRRELAEQRVIQNIAYRVTENTTYSYNPDGSLAALTY